MEVLSVYKLACFWVAAFLVLVPPTVGLALQNESLDQGGQPHRWRAPFERVTVIDFAASWCGPCRHTLPKLAQLAQDHPEVNFLVVSVDDSVDGRDELVRSLELELPVLWDDGYVIAEHYQPPAMPSTFVVDEAGEIIHRHGGSSEESWLQLVEVLQSVDTRPRAQD